MPARLRVHADGQGMDVLANEAGTEGLRSIRLYICLTCINDYKGVFV
jgi:hypothetical protein